MHPYRVPHGPDPARRVAAEEGGGWFAFGVMTFAGAVQVAIGVAQGGPPSIATVFGAACFVSGLAWLLRQGRD